ncbi:hypothetical protein JZ751_007557, partial [Albula glossodonta]
MLGLYVKKNCPDMVTAVQSAMTTFLNTRVAPWVAQQGGWAAAQSVAQATAWEEAGGGGRAPPLALPVPGHLCLGTCASAVRMEEAQNHLDSSGML